MKALQERLAATNLKMSDLRNQIQSTKQELRMAQKVSQSQGVGFLTWPGLVPGKSRLPKSPACLLLFQSRWPFSCLC